MKNICVVHLVRAQNGIGPLNSFIQSYRQNKGGVDHDLLLIFKGFYSNNSKQEYLRILNSHQFNTFDVPDIGFDITAYFSAVNKYSSEYRYFCFLNSYSVLLDCCWLKKLYDQVSQPGVGMVGATGSWLSHRKSGLIWLPYGMADAAVRHFRLSRKASISKRLLASVIAGCQYGKFLLDVDPFPNFHIRTNAFMIGGSLMESIVHSEMRSKIDAYAFESGRRGLTKQVLGRGLSILVVGKDGVGYAMEQWNRSKVFWQFDQENLLVSDNQTCDYQYGSLERRRFLSSKAWGAT